MNIKTIVETMTADTGGLVAWLVALLIVGMSLIQVSPLKLDPWDKLFSWLGGKLNTATTAKLTALDGRVAELKTQLTDMWINSHRQAILTYARECRSGVSHSSDEWSQILTIADEYEAYCVKHNISNGVVKADTEYIRNLYQQLSREHQI